MRLFATRLKELRLEKGLSATALARIIGVTDMAIFRWENGKTDITSDNLIKLAEVFSVTAGYLLGLED